MLLCAILKVLDGNGADSRAPPVKDRLAGHPTTAVCWLQKAVNFMKPSIIGSSQMNPPKRSLQEIWRLGCEGQALCAEDHDHFNALARSRFHTFALSADEAHQSRGLHEAETWVALLVRGLARELLENPGLERIWQDSDYSSSKHGKAVSFQLQKVLT